MKHASKILVGVIILLTVLSVSATFYKTVILQDFEMTGVYIEFPKENSSYVWFIYDNEEYELELETSDYEEILDAVSREVGVEETSLDPTFIEYLETAYNEGVVTNTGGEEVIEAEEGSEQELIEEDIATSTEKSSIEMNTEPGITDSEISM